MISMDVLGSIPRDDMVVKADMEGLPLVDFPDSAALESIAEIAENILNHYPSN